MLKLTKLQMSSKVCTKNIAYSFYKWGVKIVGIQYMDVLYICSWVSLMYHCDMHMTYVFIWLDVVLQIIATLMQGGQQLIVKIKKIVFQHWMVVK